MCLGNDAVDMRIKLQWRIYEYTKVFDLTSGLQHMVVYTILPAVWMSRAYHNTWTLFDGIWQLVLFGPERQGHPDACLRGPRRLSESNRIEETTRASSHYLASSGYQRLLSHSNRSFAAGDWPFKMEIARYGHLGYTCHWWWWLSNGLSK